MTFGEKLREAVDRLELSEFNREILDQLLDAHEDLIASIVRLDGKIKAERTRTVAEEKDDRLTPLIVRLRERGNLTAAISVLIGLTDVLAAYDVDDQEPGDREAARSLRARAESLREDVEKFLQSKGTGKVRAP